MEEARNNPASETDVKEKETNNNKRKRKLSDNEDDSRNSYHFKIRALCRQLRPHFLEVLRTPDFRNCKAANEIRKDLRLLLELYKQMMEETDLPANLVKEQQTLSGENGTKEQDPDKFHKGKEAELQKAEKCVENSTDLKNPMSCSSSERELNDDQVRGSYIVGGSVDGWNFITYRGSKPVYHGITKELYLSRRTKQQQ